MEGEWTVKHDVVGIAIIIIVAGMLIWHTVLYVRLLLNDRKRKKDRECDKNGGRPTL